MLRRWWLSVFLVVLAAIVWARPASAGTAAGRETRVRIFQLTRPTLVRATCPEGAERRQGNALRYGDLASGPRLRWKGRWLMYSAGLGTAGAVELYDMRARWWWPQGGVFVSVDDFGYADARSSLWGWPNQNPLVYWDPTGHRWSLDPNNWDDSTQQYFLSGQAERDTTAFFVATEMNLATGGLASGVGGLGAVAIGFAGGGLASAESDLIRTGCVNPANVATGAALGGLFAGAGAILDAQRSAAGPIVAGGGKPLGREAAKGIRTLERRIAEHEAKLAKFQADPTVRPGMEGQPPEVIQAQQATRVEHLETEIQTFRNNIEKLQGGE